MQSLENCSGAGFCKRFQLCAEHLGSMLWDVVAFLCIAIAKPGTWDFTQVGSRIYSLKKGFRYQIWQRVLWKTILVLAFARTLSCVQSIWLACPGALLLCYDLPAV